MTYRIRATRPPTDRFGSTSWDLLDSRMRPMEFALPVDPKDVVRTGAEQARYHDEKLTFKCYEVRA